MAKKRKPGRPGANPADMTERNIPGDKKSPEREERQAELLRGNLNKRKVQSRTRQSPRGK
ncbi:MAG: hypothetical protein HQ494_07710 [Rhodospirillales bacterium]|nr:hypothetical protein [Rhodospirillales bacterium]